MSLPVPASQDNKKLAVIHHHPRDELICFDDPTHKYFIKVGNEWCGVEVSATGKIGQFFGKFDPVYQIKQMRKTADVELQWNLEKKKIDESPGLLDAEIVRVEAQNEEMGVEEDEEITKHRALQQLYQDKMKQVKRRCSASTWARTCRKHPGKSDAQIEQILRSEWSNSNILGSKFHLCVENLFNDLPYDKSIEQTPEWEQFLDYKKIMIGTPYRTEWAIWGRFNDKLFSGTIDFVLVDHTDEDTLYVKLVDWKRSKNIMMTSLEDKKTGEKKMCTGPFEGLQDCNGIKYSLQLNLYRYLLEELYHDVLFEGIRYPNIKVVSMELLVCHPNNIPKKKLTSDFFGEEITPPRYKHYVIADYRDRIAKMLKDL